jgi:hypothetical protein
MPGNVDTDHVRDGAGRRTRVAKPVVRVAAQSLGFRARKTK